MEKFKGLEKGYKIDFYIFLKHRTFSLTIMSKVTKIVTKFELWFPMVYRVLKKKTFPSEIFDKVGTLRKFT